MAKAALLIEMIDLLRDRPGVTVAELAEITGRSRRTVYRWLSEVSGSLKLPVQCVDGGYYLTEPFASRRVDLTPQELLALRLSLRSSPFGEGSPIWKYSESAWQKLRDAAAWSDVEAAGNLAETHAVYVNAPKTEMVPGIAEAVEQAVTSHHRLRVVYRSQRSDQVGQYTIDPYAVAFRRHSWYVVAFCAEHNQVAQFKLARFLKAENTGVTFKPPSDFSVDDYFYLSWEAGGGVPTNVRVLFSPSVAELISESERHPTQVVQSQPDGSVILEVTVSGIEEIAIWIMGYGKEAKVLEPLSLRDYVLEHAKGMVGNYTSVKHDRVSGSSMGDVARALDVQE